MLLYLFIDNIILLLLLIKYMVQPLDFSLTHKSINPHFNQFPIQSDFKNYTLGYSNLHPERFN